MGRKDARVVVDAESDGTAEVLAERTRQAGGAHVDLSSLHVEGFELECSGGLTSTGTRPTVPVVEFFETFGHQLVPGA
jgi:hypothetical protein